MRVLIGDTGFVGRNLINQINFDLTFNSKNIQSFSKFNLTGSEIYLSCLPATKWKINKSAESKLEDLYNMFCILNSLSINKYSKIILISTIDVYNNIANGVDEDFSVKPTELGYGQNRAIFEQLILNKLHYTDLKIIRLPAVYGPHLKKNILYDMLNKNNVEKINLNSHFQWYDINDLSQDIERVSAKGEQIFNLFPEPIITRKIVSNFDESVGYEGAVDGYDYRTKHAKSGYIYSAEKSLNKIEEFINANRN